MAADLNVDMGQLIKNLFKKGEGDSAVGGQVDIIAKIMPYRNALITLVVAIAAFIGYYTMYYVPMVESNDKKMEEIKRLEDLKKKSGDLQHKIKKLTNQLRDSKEHYLESLSHFGNSEDLGELYQSVSTLAAKYGLVVLNIKEIKTAPPKEEEPKNGEKPKPKPTTEVKEVKVEVEIKGTYSEYIKFKEDLAVAEMLLKVNSENVKVKNKSDDEDKGKIFVKLNLSTYAIDKKPFRAAIADAEEASEGKKDEK